MGDFIRKQPDTGGEKKYIKFKKRLKNQLTLIGHNRSYFSFDNLE